MRHSVARLGILLFLAAAVTELGLFIVTDPAERADLFGTVWVHALIVGIFGLIWLVGLLGGPTLALDDKAVWVALRPWPRRLVVRVPWEDVAGIVEVRHQWLSAVGVTLHDPKLLRREHLGRNVDSIVENSRRHFGTDLTASLTLSNATSARIARALAHLAPAGVPWRMAPPSPARGGTVRWLGRITVIVSWVVLFLFVLPLIALDLLHAKLDSVQGSLATFVSATIGGVTLPKVLSRYERLIGQR